MSFKQESIIDPLDIDRYIDYDQAIYPSPSMSPSSASSSRGKAITTPEFHVEIPSSTFVQSQLSVQPTFSGPSHQYGLHKQQTGIPLGSLANTLAVNQPNVFGYGGFQQGFVPPTDGYFGMNTTDDIFDFNNLPSHNPSFSNTTDMDMDFDSPISDLFTPAVKQSLSNDFVDPSIISGSDDLSPASTPVQSSVGRLWPGMHQQQAALAKAQAQQKQQQTKAIQTQAPTAQRQAVSKISSSSARQAADPVVEERISRLLNQMRQNSVASSQDDAQTPTATTGSGHLARQRKDEEDMDEDERLLASEEGKKLSSKERRQLRNKVSARAFRSRRKEYIGQLEGEIATKAQEADDLKAENEALKAENTRLTDLTRMLLSSSAFSSFLNDLSTNPTSIAPATTPASAASTLGHQQPPTIHKDANPHQRQLQPLSQSSAQVGMTLIPDTTMDFSVFDPTNTTWGANMDFGFSNTQVFAVTELPEGPTIDNVDIGLLSGKSSNTIGSYSIGESKEDAPTIERMPALSTEFEITYERSDVSQEHELDAANPAFALFVDYPTSTTSSSDILRTEPDYSIFGGIQPAKAFARLDLIVNEEVPAEYGVVSAAVMARFERLCSETEAVSQRIAALTAHL